MNYLFDNFFPIYIMYLKENKNFYIDFTGPCFTDHKVSIS